MFGHNYFLFSIIIIITTITSASSMLTLQIASRYLIPDIKKGLFHPAEDAILSALVKDGSDISVYWGVYESGKTVATWNAGQAVHRAKRL